MRNGSIHRDDRRKYDTRHPLKRHWISALALGIALSGGQPVSAETLKDALAAAYMGNPQLEAQRAALRAIDENVRQANANYLPTVDGNYTHTERGLTIGVEGQPSEPRTDFNTENYRAQLDQNLFRGFRTLNAVKGAKSQVMAGRAQLTDVEQQVLQDAVTAYMDVVRDQAVLALNQNNVQVLERQLEASQDRFRVGEVTRTDVAQSEARLEGARSQVLNAEAQLATARAAYERVIGRPPSSLKTPDERPVLPPSLEDAISLATAQSPGILQAMSNEQAARYSVREAEGALLPTVTAQASLQRFEGIQFFGEGFVGFTQETREVLLNVAVPLYAGGGRYSDIRRAKQTRSQRMLEIRQAERLAQERARVAWDNYRAARGQIISSEAQVRANEIALDGVRQEAAVGSRTTLDVLDAEQELLDSRVSLVRAQRDEQVAAYTLLSAMGQLTANGLGLEVETYDPIENYDKVKWQLFGW